MKNKLLTKLKSQLPSVKFNEAGAFYWSPKNRTIFIDNAALETDTGRWSLLHEASHALLKHQAYHTDAHLLALEVAAWQKAQELGRKIQLSIKEEHVQNCLDTYRDWLYARSTCPTCVLNSLQIDSTTYLCMNCSTRWSVSGARFCRPYRMQSRHKKTPSEVNQTVFS